MAGINAKIGLPLAYYYFALPEGIGGRGAVVSSFMIVHGIKYNEAPKETFPPSPQRKKELIDAGMSKLGALPVLTAGDRHLAGHLAIVRYLEAKGGISGKDLYEDYILEELADEYVTWRNHWGSSLSGKPEDVEGYKAAREKYYKLMESFYATKANKSSPYMVSGLLPRYADLAVYSMMSDEQKTNGAQDLGKYPNLQALWNGIRALPTAKKFIV